MIPLMREAIDKRKNDLLQMAIDGGYNRLVRAWIMLRGEINNAQEEEKASWCCGIICAVKLCDILLNIDPPKNEALNNFIKSLIDFTKAVEKLTSNPEFWQLSETEEQRACLRKFLDEGEMELLFDLNDNDRHIVGITNKYLKAIDEDESCRDIKIALENFLNITCEMMFEEDKELEVFDYLNLGQNTKSTRMRLN